MYIWKKTLKNVFKVGKKNARRRNGSNMMVSESNEKIKLSKNVGKKKRGNMKNMREKLCSAIEGKTLQRNRTE